MDNSAERRFRPPVWQLPNLLSLDAPVVALVWQGFLARESGLPLRLAGRAVLALTVWAIYLGDRLLDARDPSAACETARHAFSRRHARPLWLLTGIVLLLDFLLVCLELRPAVFRNGLWPLAAVLLYLATLHSRRLRIPKELIIAILFTAGTFLIAWTASPDPWHQLGPPAAAFFGLCLLNLLAIERWEARELESRAGRDAHPATAWFNRYWFAWAMALLALCCLRSRAAGPSRWFQAVGLSAAAMVAICLPERRLPMEVRRTLIDLVLLTPLLF